MAVWTSLAACYAATAWAQQAPAGFTLIVDVAPLAEQGDACWKLEALHERVAHYAAPQASYAGLRMEVRVEQRAVAQLTLLRGGRTLARRHLTELPDVCADRLDTLALAIAMALEHAPVRAVAKSDAPGARTVARTSGPSMGTESTPSDPGPAGTILDPSDTPPMASEASRVSPEEAVGQETARSSPGHPSERVPRRPPAAESQTREQVRPTSSQRRGRDASAMFLHIGLGLLSNAAPTRLAAFSLGVQLQLSPAYSLAAAGLASNAAEERLAGGAVEARLLGGELRGCRLWLIERFGLETCLGAAAAACRAQGRNFPVRLPTTTAAWGAGLLRVALRWPQEKAISIAVVLTGHANVIRPEFGVQGSGARVAPGWLGGSAGLELVFRLL